MNNYPDLTTLAMLGEASKGFCEQLGIDGKKAFDDALNANPDLPAHERVRNAMSAMQEEYLQKLPTWMRINMLSHKISKAIEKGIPETDIDWSKIEYYLTVNLDPADFNNFSIPHSYEDWRQVLDASISAQADIIPWRREVCKDCGKDFYLYQLEIMSYLNKDLSIPKRCKCCRDKRKGIKPTQVVNNKTPEPAPKKEKEPTAMEIAMRKAGLIK